MPAQAFCCPHYPPKNIQIFASAIFPATKTVPLMSNDAQNLFAQFSGKPSTTANLCRPLKKPACFLSLSFPFENSLWAIY